MSKLSSVGSSARAGLARLLAGTLGLLAAGQALAYTNTSDGWNLPVSVTAIGKDVYDLHMLAFWICVVICVLVFGVMFYSVYAHRKSKGAVAANFHESIKVEIAWTVVPFIILIGLAIPAAGTLIKMETIGETDLSVKVTGYQWKWHYDYVGKDVSFYSTLSAESNRARQLKSGIDVNTVPNYLVDVDNELVLPVGKKVRLLITGNDVIHAWWVPDLAVKKDAIPGFINEVWFQIETPGTYRGVCAELCGRDHGFMPIVVKAVPEAEFNAWIESKGGKVEVAAAEPAVASDAAPAPVEVAAAPAAAAPAAPKALGKDELMKQGEGVYKTQCAACHQADGSGLPPNFPALKGSKVANGPAVEHIKQTLNGKGLMAPYKHLSDAEIAAVVSYERQSWGNTGSLVQPADVAAAR